jgi:hypothetical protein
LNKAKGEEGEETPAKPKRKRAAKDDADADEQDATPEE